MTGLVRLPQSHGMSEHLGDWRCLYFDTIKMEMWDGTRLESSPSSLFSNYKAPSGLLVSASICIDL